MNKHAAQWLNTKKSLVNAVRLRKRCKQMTNVNDEIIPLEGRISKLVDYPGDT